MLAFELDVFSSHKNPLTHPSIQMCVLPVLSGDRDEIRRPEKWCPGQGRSILWGDLCRHQNGPGMPSEPMPD